MKNLSRLVLCAALLAMGAFSIQAATRLSYNAGSFQSALATGKPVLVHVTALWCRQCMAQKPIVAEFAKRAEFEGLTIFEVDFDTQKDALRRLHVQKQSTIVMFKAGNEIARDVGITDRNAIYALMKKGL